MKAATTLLALGALMATTAAAQELTMAVDVPTDLGHSTYLGNQTVHHDGGNYSLDFDGPLEGLGPEVNINALDLLESGGFLFSTDAPFDVAGATFEPRDIVSYDGVTFSLFLAGTDLNLSAAADIDGLSRTADGDLVISLAAAEPVGTTDYLSGDLIRVSGLTLSIYLSAQTMGLPPGCNVVGVEVFGADEARVQFDLPVSLDGTSFLPGDIAEYASGAFSLYFRDPAFPAYSAATDFGLPVSPGEVDDLVLGKNGGDLDLSWAAGCGIAASDFAVYEGTLGNFDSHDPNVCSTLGLTSATVAADPGDRYFLVVPLNANFEGSYGVASPETERTQPAGSCVPEQKIRECT